MVVTIEHNNGFKLTETEVDLPSVPQVGDSVYLPNFRSGEVRCVDYILAGDNGLALLKPLIKVRLR